MYKIHGYIRKFLYVCMAQPVLSGCFAGQGTWIKDPIQTDAGLLAPNRPFIHMPKGDDSYNEGVRDGCQTYMGILGSGTLRNLETKMDGYRLTEDQEYLRGYVDGSSYCTFALDWDTH